MMIGPKMLLITAVVTMMADQAHAQSTFPAPLPGQADVPASNSAPVIVSPAFGDAPPQPPGDRLAVCTAGFASLREEAERRSKLIEAASERKAPPDEACRLIGGFKQSEIRMIRYVEANLSTCGISPVIVDQLKVSHGNTAKLEKQVCAMAERPGPSGPVGDFGHWINRQIP